MNNESSEKLKHLISDIEVAMMTTLQSDGKFHSRPMWTQKAEFDGALWFFAGKDSGKVDELKKNNRVCLNYAKPGSNSYVAVQGTAEVIQDRHLAEKFWNPLYRAWFPQGLDDPNLALIKVNIDIAEYWDSPSSKVVQLVGFVKALATGEPYQPGPGEHGKLAG